jgi:hypothetical protein
MTLNEGSSLISTILSVFIAAEKLKSLERILIISIESPNGLSIPVESYLK